MFPLFKISVRPVPLNNSSRSVPQRTGTEEEPAIFSIEAAQTRFDLTGFPRSQQGFPIISKPVSVFRVKRDSPAPIRGLLRSEAGIIEPAAVEKFGRAVGAS